MIHQVAQGLIGPCYQGSFVPAMNVRKVLRFYNEPYPFYGVKVRRIGRKIGRFEEVPVEALPFMPGGVIEDEDTLPRGCN